MFTYQQKCHLKYQIYSQVFGHLSSLTYWHTNSSSVFIYQQKCHLKYQIYSQVFGHLSSSLTYWHTNSSSVFIYQQKCHLKYQIYSQVFGHLSSSLTYWHTNLNKSIFLPVTYFYKKIAGLMVNSVDFDQMCQVWMVCSGLSVWMLQVNLVFATSTKMVNLIIEARMLRRLVRYVC